MEGFAVGCSVPWQARPNVGGVVQHASHVTLRFHWSDRGAEEVKSII